MLVGIGYDEIVLYEDPESYKHELIEKFRRRYGRPREKVEYKIDRFFGIKKSPLFKHPMFRKISKKDK